MQNTIASQIKDYQIIIANKQKIGCLLLEKYQDGVLLNEKIDILWSMINVKFIVIYFLKKSIIIMWFDI